MKKLTFLTLGFAVNSFILFGLSQSLIAQQSTGPLLVVDVESPEVPEASVEPKVETIRLTPEMLLPEDQGAVYIIEPKKDKSKTKLIKKVLFFGWVGDFKDWVYTDPKRKESEKEKKIREEWETMLGRDYFYGYYKAEEGVRILDKKTTIQYKDVKHRVRPFRSEVLFPVSSYDGLATYDYQTQNIEVKLSKKFG